MNSLVIASTPTSPSVDFNAESGWLQISGRSIPEHPINFYQPLENWLNDFILTNPPTIKLSIYVDYMNTHSTECILILLKRMNDYLTQNPNKNISVEWSFDAGDEDMEVLGEDLAAVSEIPFLYKQVM
ncbi:MAG: DUF1987 domain-containing protein [Vicingus serpentipes]|nr:DUF1987 domain-containing protein [Vicingus serpentipes]